MKDKRSLLRKIKNSNITLIVISVLLSLMVWAVVKINFSEETTKTLTGVKVNLDSSLAAENSFFPFCTDEDLQVDVQLSGKSYDLNSKAFSAGDIIVEASSGYVDSSGYKVLNLTATTTNPDLTVISVNPSSLTIFFDRQETMTFDVEARLTNEADSLTTDGFILGKPVPSFSTVDVEGPATVIASLQKVIFSATVDKKELPLKETTELSATIEYEMSNERGKSFLSCKGIGDDASLPTVTVPINEVRTVPTSVKFINQPNGYAETALPVSIEPESVEVSFAGNEEAVDSIVIGTIDFRQLSNRKNVFRFDAEASSAYTFISDVKSFEVTVDLSSYSAKKLDSIPGNVVFTGKADGKKYSLSDSNSALKSIVIIGPKESLSSISADSLQIEINVSKLDADAQTARIKASNITIPSSEDCWVYGEYLCSINIS